MVSFLHEGVLELVRHHPAFVAELLSRVLGVPVPRFTEARLTDTTLNELVPVEYHADAVVLFVDDKPVFGAIVEAQLATDARKLFTWPLYAVSARARHECPFVVIAVTPDPATARWAAQPIELGGNTFRVQVIGPEGVPVITEIERAKREPELAVLSVLAHGDGDPDLALAIATAAGAAISAFPEEQRVLYYELIGSALSGAARKAFDMLLGEKKTFLERQYDRGRAEGKIEAILQVLAVRGLVVREDQRKQIIACTDVATLERWLASAVSSMSVDALLALPG